MTHVNVWRASTALLVLALVTPAEAQVPACESLPEPIVYMQIGDTQQPLIKHLGRSLRDSATLPITLVYRTSGSCTNIDAFYNQTAIPAATNLLYIPSTAENGAWTTSMAALPCTLTNATQIDVANSALFVSACTTSAAPGGVRKITGPIQAYVMAVPEASTQVAMTAEEAYFVFGFGAAGMAEPWVNESLMFIRTITKSTLLTWAANILVPGAKWKGIRFDSSTDVVNNLVNAANPEQAIGILGAEVYDTTRNTLNSLAFRAFGQRYAYYPDSTPTSFDKRNLREGRYTVWSPTEYLIRESGGNPVNANAAAVVDLILGRTTSPAADFNSLSIVMSKGLVPECAMKVTRDVEGGPLSLYTAPEPCGCFFDSINSTTSCTACVNDDPCGTGACRHGFCEAR